MKKTAYFFLAVIFILVFITGCGEKPAYYRSINLDGKYSIVGQYPVSAKRAQKINSYHFIYDDKGRVSKIQYQHLGRPAGHDPLFGISAVAIEYGKDYEKRSFCDAAGRIVPNKDGIYSLRLKLNEKKEPEAVFFYNKDGQLSEDKSGVAQISWALDDWSRRIIKAVRFNAKGQSISAFEGGYETYYVYDDQGNLIEQSNRGKNGELVEDRDGVAVIKLGYDGQNLIEAAYYGNNEQLAFPRGRSFALIRWQYDGNNKIEESYYGADRQLKTLPPLDYALIRWQYNADGNLEEESYMVRTTN